MPSLKCFKVSEAFLSSSNHPDYNSIISQVILGSYFTSVECFVLPGKIDVFPREDHNKGILYNNKQVKHLLVETLPVSVRRRFFRRCFPNLESFEMTDTNSGYYNDYLCPTKRLVVKSFMYGLNWNSLSPALEAIEVSMDTFKRYRIHGNPVFPHLTTLRLHCEDQADIRSLARFMKDHKEVIRELAFDATRKVDKEGVEDLTGQLSLVETLHVVVYHEHIFEVLVRGIREHADNLKKLSFSYIWGAQRTYYDLVLKAEKLLAVLPSGDVSCINGTVHTFVLNGLTNSIDKEEQIAEVLCKSILSGNPKTIILESIRHDHIDGWVTGLQTRNPNFIVEKTKVRFYTQCFINPDVKESARIMHEAEFGDTSNIPSDVCLNYRLSVSLKSIED